ncbi:hypothetical protein LIER_38140 [Lithospermum erythrorhizon]|uniref:Uncharacterized protein n=1 Tax=Lithospermum erythrorhizon TaxID=34254 RepID=A0AAV3PVD9_LITER
MAHFELSKEEKMNGEEFTKDGAIDLHGRPAIRGKTGRWFAGIIVLCESHTHTMIVSLLPYFKSFFQF